MSREESSPSSDIIVVTDTGIVPVTGTSLDDRYFGSRAARLNFLWGVRNVGFKRVEGFDALTGEQDVRTGFQLAVLFGRSLSVLGTHDDDILVSSDVYAGVGTARSFAAIQLLGEGRQSYDDNRWDDILTSGRAAWYFKPSARDTPRSRAAEWSGGWRQRAPFQLNLGEPRGGMRGYSAAELPGRPARCSFASSSDGCSATFGATRTPRRRCWERRAACGRVMFRSARRSPMKYAVGTSLLAALPPGSQRLWRLDLMMPLDRSTGANLGASAAQREQHPNLLARAARRRAESRAVVAAADIPVAVAAASAAAAISDQPMVPSAQRAPDASVWRAIMFLIGTISSASTTPATTSEPSSA